MRNSYSMVGIDEIALVDPLNGELCSKSFRPKMPKLKIDRSEKKRENSKQIETNEINEEIQLKSLSSNISQSLSPMMIVF